MKPYRPLAFVLFLACVFLAGSTARGGEAPPVPLGRAFKAIPWLEYFPNVPFAIVPYRNLPISADIPERDAIYTIDSDVAASGYTYFYHVAGLDDDFVTGSTINLTKLIHELAVIEEIKKRHKGKEFAQGVGDGVKGIGTGIANLVIHPGLSMKSAGNRLRQTGRSIERAVGAEETIGKDESGTDRSQLGAGPAGAARRGLAYELGVDVYTANPVLRHALTELSHAQAAGSFVTWAIPYHIGLLNYFNPLTGDEKTELLIRDSDPYELRRTLGQELEPLFGISREDGTQPLQAFLMNPNFSPRMIAYGGLDFQYLRTARNLRIILEELAGVATPEEADVMTLDFRLYSLLHRNVQPIAEFRRFRNFFAAIGTNGVMYMMAPVDTVRPWNETAKIFGELLNEARQSGVAGLEVWCIGDVHPTMVENAARAGVTVRQHILRDPVFFPHPAPKQ